MGNRHTIFGLLRSLWTSAAAATSLCLAAPVAGAANEAGIPTGPPSATIDLTTREGVERIHGAWRYSDTRITEVDFRAVGPDNKPSGAPNRTYDFTPHAGGVDYDDSGWEVVDPATLSARRANGKLCFDWYRLRVTIPENLDGFVPAGATLVFETVVDDYAEIWVDGQLPRHLGSPNPNLVAGWNAPNRLVIGRDIRPGQTIQLAIFGINGPLSDPPPNYIWLRSAKLLFYSTPRAIAPQPVATRVIRKSSALEAIVPPDAAIEKLAEGFTFIEGPVWLPEGALLFSEPNANKIWKWTPDNRLELFLDRSGYDGADIAAYRQPGSNGLALDPQGRLVIDQHGNRRVVRLEKDGQVTVLADRYEGKRLNSPNDLVFRSDGTLYFTDPPFGLPQFHDDSRRELDFFGVFALRNGRLSLVSRDFRGPNGIALSPDEKYLYVANWDEARKVVNRYEVRRDGSLGPGKLFYDMTGAPGEEALDGVEVDRQGNLYVSGPGGVWILSPAGEHLGTLQGSELAANFAWGDADGRTLYMTARTGLYRVRLNVPGLQPAWQDQARAR